MPSGIGRGLTSLLLLVGSAPAGAASTLADLNTARNLERFQPDKACEIYQKLAQSPEFVLADVAFLRQGSVCLHPLENPPYDLSKRPWLNKFDAQRRLRLAERKQDWLEMAERQGELARQEKSQKVGLEILNETGKKISASEASPEIKKQASERLQQFRQEMAPRFLIAPKPEQQLRVAQDFLNARDFDSARKIASQIMKRKSSSFEEWLGARRIRRTSFKLEGRTDEFLSSLRDDWAWSQKQKNPHKSLEMGLLLAKAQWTEGKNELARKTLNEIEKKWSSQLRMNDVEFVRGKMAEEKKEWAQALKHYQKPKLDLKTATDKKIQFAKAWAAWKSEQHQASIEALEPLIALAQEEPFESSRALYWKARNLKKLSQDEAARQTLQQLRAQDPLGFYGVIAVSELKEQFPPLQLPAEATKFPKSDFYDADYFQALLDAGELEILQAAASWSLAQAGPQKDLARALPLFTAAAKANSYLPLFSVISSLTPEDRNELLKRDPHLIFPLDYRDLIVANANKFGIPPELSLSIIRQESAFNPFARSPADALGLMQLIPAVVRSYEKEVNVKVEHFEDLYRPEVNVPYGTILLRDLLRRYDQKVFLAAAAYNASEKALRQWQKMRWNGDPVEFIEEIPYEETRAYVKLIIRNFAFYSRLLKPGQSTPFPKACLGD